MSDNPTAEELAIALGITELQVTMYLIQCHGYGGPNNWMITLSPDTPDDLRKKLKLNKALVRTVMLPPRRPVQ